MERLLLWWDDVDDLAAVCRHLLKAAFAEALAFALTPARGQPDRSVAAPAGLNG
jgi:hypothetical protein